MPPAGKQSRPIPAKRGPAQSYPDAAKFFKVLSAAGGQDWLDASLTLTQVALAFLEGGDAPSSIVHL
jgi:hypothetical protein